MSEQTISARFKCQSRTLQSFSLSVYVQTNEAEEEVKQEFHHQLHTAFIKMKKRNLIVIIGFINAEMSGVIHENGKMFCASNGLEIWQTFFPRKKSHKLTWRSPDRTSENQIGHATIAEHGGAG